MQLEVTLHIIAEYKKNKVKLCGWLSDKNKNSFLQITLSEFN